MTTVYRVENDEHVGPYATSVPGMNHMGSAHQPAPWDTGLGWINTGELSGFDSLDQLLDWFDAREDLDNLERGGMSVVRINVDEGLIRRGAKHLVFREEILGSNPRDQVSWGEVRSQLDQSWYYQQLRREQSYG